MKKKTLRFPALQVLFQQNGGTLAHHHSFLVLTKWRHTFTPLVIVHFSKTDASLILRFNKMAVQLHTTNNYTCQQNGATLAHHQQFLKFKVK
jgi:hypothetical protein